MTHREKITGTLNISGAMCDDCLSSSSAVKPRQAVNIQCRELERLGKLTRHKDRCPQCKKVKIVNRLLSSTGRIRDDMAEFACIEGYAPEITRSEYSEGEFPNGEMENVVAHLATQIAEGDIEIYNEFSLQHELGILLRTLLPQKKIQFERNVSFFGFDKSKFEKREIDIAVYDNEACLLDAAIELKFPRNGQHPEQMYSFCKDVVFAEQLKASGFNKAYVVIFAEDRLFYEGGQEGIYGFFRGGRNLSGVIPKPTGKRNSELTISGSYKVVWRDVCNSLKYTIIEVQ